MMRRRKMRGGAYCRVASYFLWCTVVCCRNAKPLLFRVERRTTAPGRPTIDALRRLDQRQRGNASGGSEAVC